MFLIFFPSSPRTFPVSLRNLWRNAGDQESYKCVSFTAKAQAYNARSPDLSPIGILL
jgi:hypothetical protein